jgi:D-sedoheptulose 7-phosphate isomerase
MPVWLRPRAAARKGVRMGAGVFLEDVSAAFARRDLPTASLCEAAPELARCCHAMARRFHRGGRLLAFGAGCAAADAAHVVVEFVHPVIVGKRALPALALAEPARLRLFAEPTDIAVGICADGNDQAVADGLVAARDAGLLTVALLGGDGGMIARLGGLDHVLVVPSADQCIVREAHVTAYHVLWELVHVFLDEPGVL